MDEIRKQLEADFQNLQPADLAALADLFLEEGNEAAARRATDRLRQLQAETISPRDGASKFCSRLCMACRNCVAAWAGVQLLERQLTASKNWHRRAAHRSFTPPRGFKCWSRRPEWVDGALDCHGQP